MLVEINLLPKKEQRNHSFIVLIMVLSILLIATGIYLFNVYSGYKDQIKDIEQEIQLRQEVIADEQAKAKNAEKNNSLQQLNDLIHWSENYPIKTVSLLKHLIALLPERGFFMNFNYVSEGTVQISAQFDTSREAATYLDELIQSQWTKEVKLTAVTTVANDAVISEGNPKGENNTEGNKESNLASQTVTVNKTSPQLENEPYLPRYLAVYEIKLDKTFIHNKELEDKESDEIKKPSSEKGDGNE